MRCWQGMVAALVCAAAFCTAGCETVPETGRTQFIIVSPGQEATLGEESYRETLSKVKLSANAADTETLRRVGMRVAAQARRPDYNWEFNLVESKELNAFCLPGGKVAVYTGILPVCGNEAALAAVVSHEVSHALARHGAERMSQAMVTGLVGTAIEQGTARSNAKLRSGVLAAYGAGATIGVLLPYSRLQEKEADEIGLTLMARAGYDPREALAFWQRMAAQGKSGPPEWLRTHPTDEHRIAALRALLPAAEKAYRDVPEKYGAGSALTTNAPATQ